MSRPIARVRRVGYALAAADALAALALVRGFVDIGTLAIEATLLIIAIAAVAGWLIVVE